MLNKNKTVSWVEPWKGLDKNGKEVVVDVKHSVSVDGAINMARDAHFKQTVANFSDTDLLNEFIIVHWAEIEED